VNFFCIPTVLFAMAIANAKAVKDSIVYCLEKNDFERLIQRCSEVAIGLLRCLSGRIMNYSDFLENLAFSNTSSRLAKILLKHHVIDSAGNKVCQLSQNEITSMTGTCRETVCRILNCLKRENIISIQRRKIIIHDIKKLKAKCVRY